MTISTEDYDDHMAEAIRLLRAPDNEAEKARSWIEGVAKKLTDNRDRDAESPRPADIKRDLEEATKQAQELITFLGQKWTYARQVAAGYSSLDDWETYPEGTPRDIIKHLKESPHVTPGIIKLLSFDSESLSNTLSEFIDFANIIEKVSPKDTGGEKRLFSQFHGTPKMVLAIHCWELFRIFRPGEAVGTVGGDYYGFTAQVYELATGKGANEDGVGLEKYTKKAAKACNDLLKSKPVLDRLLRAATPPVGIFEVALRSSLLAVPQRIFAEVDALPRKKRSRD